MSNLDWLYSDTVKEHFMNPRNTLVQDEEFPADGEGMTGNIRCGDQMLFRIQVEDDRIKDCRWKTYGCASAIASTSLLSEMVKGMPLEKAYRITPEDILAGLGGLPSVKVHCSVLGDKALRAAIEDYFRKTGQEDRIKVEEAVIVCQCLNVTDKDIENAVKDGCKSYEELQQRTKIGTACGQCKERAIELLHEFEHLYGE
jgi:nitrogen fixation NifU-like protein